MALVKRRSRQRIREEDVLKDGLKIGFWDIETGGLAATFSSLLVVGVKPAGKEKPTIYRIDDFPGFKKCRWDDRPLAYEAKKALEQYDVLVSYNGISFDTRYLNSRLVFHGIKPLSADIKHCDLYKTVRARLRLHSNSLDALLKHIKSDEQKTPLTPDIWRRAVAGDRTALDNIVKHNIQDVKALEVAFNRLVSMVDLRFHYAD